ncbi:MAG: metal ABC transporter ATP-binding protein [Alloprevotella sp.]
MNTSALLQLEDVALGYGRRTVLQHVTMVIRQGDFHLLCGHNGGGKTTLLRLMAGLNREQAGSVVRADNLTTGYLPQQRKIDRQFPITALQVVLDGLASPRRLLHHNTAEERRQALQLLQELSLSAELAQRPIQSLSGGEWQRILLARAVISRPRLLLLDEPDTHLDIKGRRIFYDYLARLQHDCAIVLVSHDPQATHCFPTATRWLVEDGTAIRQE